ncbi:hypothetical protein HU200_002349 [Digitaria exilis]|uniref:Thioredoxin-like fold domain-containing protein n=1 Tax=Digitaria exilis TaxID=1010633 RepID=A0A835FWZ5_9POAL|nr:hypothetical protein HU200_002349 [Digitaria exilis]
MHVLPDLEFVEKKYKDKPCFDDMVIYCSETVASTSTPYCVTFDLDYKFVICIAFVRFYGKTYKFAVVGVHSAKFDNEKDLDAIRNAVLRYNITHPVVNDGDMYLWRELGVNSWPTFVLIGPNGKVLAQISGEGHRKDLDDVVGAALEFYEEKNLLRNDPLPLALEKDKDSRLLASPLKFPGKLAVDVQNNRLFISDIFPLFLSDVIKLVTNLEGKFICQVGSSDEGLLDGPFDAALFNRPQGLAYNSKRNVLYVADTENHALRSAVLNSPWDVCYDPSEENVYIAMAGQHQIWKHNIRDGVTKVLSGDGYERNFKWLKFGDYDGTGSDVLLQHPLGVVYAGDNQIYVADSYNHKLSEPAGLVVIGEAFAKIVNSQAKRKASCSRYNNMAIRYITLSEKGADEARSKFDVETEPANAIEIEPANGVSKLRRAGITEVQKDIIVAINGKNKLQGELDGSSGKNCVKVYYCKEDEVCLYQSVAFDVKFNGGAADAGSSAAQFALSYSVTAKR